MRRRDFIRSTGMASLGAFAFGPALGKALPFSSFPGDGEMFFKLSLAEWSLHKALWKREMTNLDFPMKAKELGIHAIEYVNQFFRDKAEDSSYLDELNKICSGEGITQLLIMVDGEGYLGDLDGAKRKKAVENHYKWVSAAKHLGCHSIRVNAHGEGTGEEVASAAVNGLGELASFAKDYGINVLVENHGGYSSNGQWLAGVMSEVNMENCGTLPDFGNFCTTVGYGSIRDQNCKDPYDIYQGVDELMPYAKAVSAKAYAFDESGDETIIDFERVMSIVQKHGYSGYVGIEYEGNKLSEVDGILATKKLLEKVGSKLSGE